MMIASAETTTLTAPRPSPPGLGEICRRAPKKRIADPDGSRDPLAGSWTPDPSTMPPWRIVRAVPPRSGKLGSTYMGPSVWKQYVNHTTAAIAATISHQCICRVSARHAHATCCIAYRIVQDARSAAAPRCHHQGHMQHAPVETRGPPRGNRGRARRWCGTRSMRCGRGLAALGAARLPFRRPRGRAASSARCRGGTCRPCPASR